jgi:hypothetical protein
VHQGFITVCPPVTEQPASNAQSLNPLIICKTSDRPILIHIVIFKYLLNLNLCILENVKALMKFCE